MDLVSVDEDSNQWRNLYLSMVKGKASTFKDLPTGIDAIDGLPAPVNGADGNLQLPKEAGNVVPPKSPKASVPDTYRKATPHVSKTLDTPGTTHGPNLALTAAAAAAEASKTTTTMKKGRTKKKSTTRRRPVQKKRRPSKGGIRKRTSKGGRKRVNIVRRRRR